MATDLDTVRVMRALFNDMPRAPHGLDGAELMAWIQQAMIDYEGGDLAYAVDHITRSSMLDIILHMRETGALRADDAFEQVVQEISTPEGRKAFMDRCILAQYSVNATDRLLRRARSPWEEPEPLFRTPPEAIDRLVRGLPAGAGPLTAEFAARDDVRRIGVMAQGDLSVHEFDWGFVTESAGAWNFYVAEVWRAGTVGYFERFLDAWKSAFGAVPIDTEPVPKPPAWLSVEDGIASFSCIRLVRESGHDSPTERQWVGEVFVARLLPLMAARALTENYVFPLHWHAE